MRVNRQKKVNKYLKFYINNFGFRKPYQVLVDGTFCHVALQSKVNIHEQLSKYLGGDVKILTTPCAILETEGLGPQVYGAMLILKQFPVHQCGHKEPVAAALCIRNNMLGRNNPNRYILATQDRDLQNVARRIPGTPILYIYNKAPTLEKPSSKTSFIANKQVRQSYKLSKSEKKNIKEIKAVVLGPETKVKPFKKKKRKGGPNPLSCKKKKCQKEKKQGSNQSSQ